MIRQVTFLILIIVVSSISVNQTEATNRLEKELTPLIDRSIEIIANETIVQGLDHQTIFLHRDFFRIDDMLAMKFQLMGTGAYKIEGRVYYDIGLDQHGQGIYSHKLFERNVNFNNNNEYELIKGVSISDILFTPFGYDLPAINRSSFDGDQPTDRIGQWDRIVGFSIDVINGMNRNVSLSAIVDIVTYRYALPRSFIDRVEEDRRNFSLRLINHPFKKQFLAGGAFKSDSINWVAILPFAPLHGATTVRLIFKHEIERSLTSDRLKLGIETQSTSSIDKFQNEASIGIDYDDPILIHHSNITIDYINSIDVRGAVKGSIELISITFEFIDHIPRSIDILIEILMRNTFTTLIYLQLLLWGVYAGMQKKRQKVLADKVNL
jgi:hypothetical protein